MWSFFEDDNSVGVRILSLRRRELLLLPPLGMCVETLVGSVKCIECRFILRSGNEGEERGISVGDSRSLCEDRLANGKDRGSGFARLGDATGGIGDLELGVNSGGVFGLDTDFCSGAGRSFLLRDPLGPIVLLRVNFIGISVIVSCGVCGFRAWATASGPANLGRMGAAMLPAIKLASTVTGKTFSFNRSFFFCSPPPNTICCTLL
jgi:hypothetical protein